MKAARYLAFGIFAIGATMLFLVATGTIRREYKEKKEELVSLADSTPRHPVTHKMTQVSDSFKRKAAPDFSLFGVDKKQYTLSSLTSKGPTVLIALLDECPCTTDSQPLFNAMAKKFEGKATFVGLFVQAANRAPKWIESHSVKMPVLLDNDSKTCRAYGLENSVYTVLIRPDRTIEKIWPGYSQDMLKELDMKLSELTSFKGEPFDVAYAPKRFSSGCTIYVGEATKSNPDKNPGAHD